MVELREDVLGSEGEELWSAAVNRSGGGAVFVRSAKTPENENG